MTKLRSPNSITRRARIAWRPEPKCTVSEWADKHRFLPPESAAAPGKWRNTNSPHMRGPMDAYNDRSCEIVACMFSAQMAKSEGLLNVFMYAVDRRPGPILLVQPTANMAKDFVKDRVDPSVRDTPVISAKIRPGKRGESTLCHKKFPGGHLTAIGANSPTELASRPIRDVLGDEIDRWPISVGKNGQVEGDPFDLLMKRTTTFPDRKAFIVSTPTVKDLSRIEKLYLAGTQETYHIPCPHCGALQALVWENVRFDFDAPERAVYVCAHCEGEINDAQKRRLLQRGQWVAKCPENSRIRSFHINELASPWRTLGQVATDYVAAYKNGKHSLRVFYNTVLGMPWDDKGALRLSAEGLRAHEYAWLGKIPADAAFLTAAVDVQKDRLEVMFMAHSPYSERWVVPHLSTSGEVMAPVKIWGSYQKKETWAELDKLLGAHWEHWSGKRIRPSVVFIDSSDGSAVQHVHKYVKPRHTYRIFACKGMATPNAPALGPVREYGNLRAKTFPLGTNSLKTTVYDALVTNDVEGPGYIHFPKGLQDDFYNQLTAEKAEVKVIAGMPTRVWTAKKGVRNEVWDLLNYNVAASWLIRMEDAVKLLESLSAPKE